jgi:hypothetical protein
MMEPRTRPKQQQQQHDGTYYYGSTIASEFEYIKNHRENNDVNRITTLPAISEPLTFNETCTLVNSDSSPTLNISTHDSDEQITINGESGVWINKSESTNWKGPIPLTDYMLNEDPNPEIIRKKSEKPIVYNQEIAIRYLRPPTPPPPGPLIIREEKGIILPTAPPLIMRQKPPRPETPAPLVIREAPPQSPNYVESKIITIPGKRLPPPPRKVIVERLPPLPSRPQAIIIERWLPYKQQKRRVIFTGLKESENLVQKKERNIIIQWEPPEIKIKKDFKDLGVVRVNPKEYIEKYGSALQSINEMPDVVKEIEAQNKLILAADASESIYELVGDIQALALIDLEKEGLSEYKSLVKQGSLTRNSTTDSSSSRIRIKRLVRPFDDSDKKCITTIEAKDIFYALNNKLERQVDDPKTIGFLKYLENFDSKIELNDFKESLRTYI